MENDRRQKGRRGALIPDLFQRSGALSCAGSLLLCCLSLLAPPALLPSCSKAGPEALEDNTGPAAADSVFTCVRWTSRGAPAALDLFIYDHSGTKSLEKHLQLDASRQEGIQLLTLPGEKILVGIADSPKRFNLNALARFDAMEQLSFRFEDEHPDRPVQGGYCISSGQDGTLELEPLLCTVILASVSNNLDGYELLEDPRVRLRDLPDAAEILRRKDFRPESLIDAGAWQALPCDIGFFTQHPQTRLYCYPNDTPEHILGTPRPSLEFECRIGGEPCSFEVPLPPLGRGGTCRVELSINGPGDYRYTLD